MVSIAAGMESEFSDSDCDIVFCPTAKSPEVKSESISSEFVPLQSSASNSQNNLPPNSIEDSTIPTQRYAPSSSRQSYHSYRGRSSRGRRRVVSNNAQPLDDLRYATMQGNLDVVQSILGNGIWIDSILKAGWTALMYACSSAQHEIVSYLLENKADPNYHKDSFTPLMAVCVSTKEHEDLLKCCRHLLQYGAEVNVHERHLMTPLMFAAREGNLPVVKELLNYYANVDSRDNHGRTALFWAAAGGYGQIVRLLLMKGADPQEVNFAGQTAADLASEKGYKEVAALLEKSIVQKDVNGGVNISNLDYLPDDKRKSALMKHLHNSTASGVPKSKGLTKQNELDLFLNGLGFPSLVEVFREHELEFSDILVMNDEELEKVGIDKVGVRQKILEAVKATHKKDWQNSSLPSLKNLQYISCPDAVAMLANIAKHLKYINSTVIYIRQQIQREPRILELGQDTASIHDLSDEIVDARKNARNIGDDLRYLERYIDEIRNNVEFKPADQIIEKVPEKCHSSKTTKIVLGFLIISIAVGGFVWKRPDNLTHITTFIQSKFTFLHKV